MGETNDVRVMPIPDGLLAPGTAHGVFEPVALVSDTPPGTMTRVTRGDVDLLVVHSSLGIAVTDDRCPHMAAPLSVGAIVDCVIACPLHRGRFDIGSGDVVQFPTTGGLDAEGQSHAPWTPGEAPAKADAPTELKARARAATRVRRLRYYPVRVSDDTIEIVWPR
jgi:nitrite reductase/ring-hydroxylating ferredoxin subunit